jgi:hypothetical protein
VSCAFLKGISHQSKLKKRIHQRKTNQRWFKTLLDSRGNIVKDSLGKLIQIDNLKTIQIRIYEFYQACHIAANVNFVDLNNNRLLESFPIATESIFENTYATYKGDRRAYRKRILF